MLQKIHCWWLILELSYKIKFPPYGALVRMYQIALLSKQKNWKRFKWIILKTYAIYRLKRDTLYFGNEITERERMAKFH